MPQPGRGVPLWVEVDQQHLLVVGGECGGEVDRRGGLADATLLVGDRQDARAGPGAGASVRSASIWGNDTAGVAHPEDAGVGGGIRLAMRSARMCHSVAACVNSDSTLAPFRNRHCPPGASNGAARAGSSDNGARARAVTSGAAVRRVGFQLGRTNVNLGSGNAGGLAQEGGFALVGLDQIETERP